MTHQGMNEGPTGLPKIFRPQNSLTPHLENVCLQDVVAKLHGLLAVQLAFLSREHERQQSMSIPRTRNPKAHDKIPPHHRPSDEDTTLSLNCHPWASA